MGAVRLRTHSRAPMAAQVAAVAYKAVAVRGTCLFTGLFLVSVVVVSRSSRRPHRSRHGRVVSSACEGCPPAHHRRQHDVSVWPHPHRVYRGESGTSGSAWGDFVLGSLRFSLVRRCPPLSVSTADVRHDRPVDRAAVGEADCPALSMSFATTPSTRVLTKDKVTYVETRRLDEGRVVPAGACGSWEAVRQVPPTWCQAAGSCGLTGSGSSRAFRRSALGQRTSWTQRSLSNAQMSRAAGSIWPGSTPWRAPVGSA